jgi:hypothetical protein
LTRVLKVVFVSGEDAISAVLLVVFLAGTIGAADDWFED